MSPTQSDPNGADLPVVSVVVPTYNRVDRLRLVLDALSQQDYGDGYEVVVVSDGSTDGTLEMLASYRMAAPLVTVAQDNQGPSAARNAGIARARGKLVLFVDDDVVAAPDLINAHVAAHRKARWPLAVIGSMLSPPGIELLPWVEWEQRMLYKQYRALTEGRYEATFRQFYTGNASVQRELLLEAGGFDVTFRRAEDVELGMRLAARGVTFTFEPLAIGYHHAERSFEGWRLAARWYGRSDVDFASRNDSEGGGEFLLRNYRTRPWPLRTTIRLALAFPDAAELAAARTGALVVRIHHTRARRFGSWLLSAANACDYWRGVAERLGGTSGLYRELKQARQ